jgi:hypothetical protein
MHPECLEIKEFTPFKENYLGDLSNCAISRMVSYKGYRFPFGWIKIFSGIYSEILT